MPDRNDQPAAQGQGGTAVPAGTCVSHGYHGLVACPHCSTSAIPPAPLRPESSAASPRAEERWILALRRIINVLGPDLLDCEENKCEGCKAEAAEALRIAKEALGVR